MDKNGIERLRDKSKACGCIMECAGCTSTTLDEIADQIECERAEDKGRIESLESDLRMLAVNGGSPVDIIALVDLARELCTCASVDPDGDNRVAERILKALTYAPRPSSGDQIAKGDGEEAERPTLLAADGLPIEVGQTVWLTESGIRGIGEVPQPLTIRDIKEDGGIGIHDSGDSAESPCWWLSCGDITHTPPDTQERIDDDAMLPAPPTRTRREEDGRRRMLRTDLWSPCLDCQYADIRLRSGRNLSNETIVIVECHHSMVCERINDAKPLTGGDAS